MSARQAAQRFLDELRAQVDRTLSGFPDADPSLADVDRMMREVLAPGVYQDPRTAERIRQSVTQSRDEGFDVLLRQMQGDIEKTAADRISGADTGSCRPLIGHLRTGQLNAVSMRVPGEPDAYLVLFEDQMPLFASKLSKALVWATYRIAARAGTPRRSR